MRFRPEQHLSRQSDIRAVREQGRRLEGRAFTIWWTRRPALTAALSTAGEKSPESPPTSASQGVRVCVIASTAAVGAAVQRNRAKRRLREVFRHHQQLVPSGCDLLLIARQGALQWPMSELQRKFADACAAIPAGNR